MTARSEIIEASPLYKQIQINSILVFRIECTAIRVLYESVMIMLRCYAQTNRVKFAIAHTALCSRRYCAQRFTNTGWFKMACADTNIDHTRHKRFLMIAPPAKTKLFRVGSKASEPALDDSGLAVPSTKILSHFQSSCSMWIALDVKTHNLLPHTALYQGWVAGQFGHMCCVNECQLQDLRVVQIDWSIGRFDACSDPLTKSLLVKPDGFEISEAAAAKHGITTEKALAVGSPISRVLAELLADFADVRRCCGRVCACQLEFDMGVIKCEMERAELHDELHAWRKAAMNGFCIMNPDITDWACTKFVEHARHHTSIWYRKTISFQDMVRALLPGRVALLENHHEAGANSRMTWLVVRQLFRRVARAAANE